MTTTSRVYLDFNASTPVAPEVVQAMTPFLTQGYGNPSSVHWASRPAKEALEHARADVAALIHASPEEVVFTSGGSEATTRQSRVCSSGEGPLLVHPMSSPLRSSILPFWLPAGFSSRWGRS